MLAVLGAFLLYTTHRDQPVRLWRWGGQTMGSSYTVQVVARGLDEKAVEGLQAEAEAYLADLNAQLSTWLPGSALSRFNQDTTTAEVAVSPLLADVARLSLDISRLSGGAFDVTFGPMFDLWGFGRSGPKRVPDEASFARVLATCGYTHLDVPSPTTIRKNLPGVQVAFNALVPGYAAEHLTGLLRAHGLTNTYVDVGGEAVVRGRNLKGEPWRIGIERPIYDTDPGADLEAIVVLSDRALATSGDYRNYFKDDAGNVYAHIFDPRTGRPATSRVASVSVVATNGGLADALATTLFVMGPEEGLPWLARLPDTEALFVMRESETSFREIASPGFEAVSGYRARSATASEGGAGARPMSVPAARDATGDLR